MAEELIGTKGVKQGKLMTTTIAKGCSDLGSVKYIYSFNMIREGKNYMFGFQRHAAA